MGTLIQDIRYALRSFRVTPALTIVIVSSLAIGIGANTAMYSVIDALFLRELPVRNPDGLVAFGWQAGPSRSPFREGRRGISSSSSGGSGEERITTLLASRFTELTFEKFRSQREGLSEVAAFAAVDIDASIDGRGDEITAQLVSGNYFQTVGVGAIAGRTIETADDIASSVPAVVISHGFWSRRFARDPSAIGKQVTINGTLSATIVGVTPADFHIGRGGAPDFSLPLALEGQLASGLLAPDNWSLGLVGRMNSGARLEQVKAGLQGVFQAIALEEAPNTAPADMPRLEVFSARQGFSSDVVLEFLRTGPNRTYLTLAIVSGVFVVLLCIVGLNVANLLIARAATRQYEIGVRLAMGAGRRRLIRQLLTESVLLALAGGGLGILLADVGKDLLRVFLQTDARTVMNLQIAPEVLAFSAVVSLLTGLLFGLAPALRATRMDVNTAVKQGGRTIQGSRSGIGRTLLVVQVAMSVVLLVGASLLLRTVGNLPGNDVGFNAANMLAFRINTQALNGDRGRYNQIVDAVRSLPGTLALTTSTSLLLSGSGTFTDGRFHPPVDGQASVAAEIRVLEVDANFFEVLGIPLVRGRSFGPGDVPGLPRGAVITESIARLLNSEPIGWRWLQNPGSPQETYLDIVGVVKNVGISEVGRALDGTVFLATTQQQGVLPSMFEVRTAGPPLPHIPAIREALRRIDPNLRASQVFTETELVRQRLAPTRYIAMAWSAFGGVALLLTSIGLYGLLSHTVARRTNEIGIRMALGARGHQVLRSVLSQVFLLVVAGVTLGLGLSLLINLIIRPFVYGVSFNDPLTIALAAAVMLLVAGIAGYFPARRATLVDPTIALRHE